MLVDYWTTDIEYSALQLFIQSNPF